MRIAIIGAGYTGTTLATELATSRDTDLDVCLIGAPGNFGGGVAYGDARSEHLLNARALQMGATADAPAGFARWLNLSERGKEAFLPRVAYGEYLLERLHEAERTSTNLTSIEQEAIEIDRLGTGGYRVHLDDGQSLRADRVVLAVGALPPQRLAGVGPRLARDPRYLDTPWQSGDLQRIAPDARLLIVGTGLTMVDVIASLHRQGHRGEILALSRHGLLPLAHTESPADPIELPPSVLHALRAHDLHALTAALRALARAVEDWRAVVDALRPQIAAFWGGLTQVQRGRFLRHLRAYWEVHRHRMAPRAAETIAQAREEGRLRVMAGRLLRAGVAVEGAEKAVYAVIRARGAVEAERLHFDGIVRATGLETDITRTTHPLIQHLLALGTLQPDPLGLGLRTSRCFEVLDATDAPVPGLYCVGALARGHCWELTAVGELRSAVRLLAQRLRAAAGGAADAGSRAETLPVRLSC